MDRQAVRQVFEQIAASLAIKGDNPFKIRAFENAGRTLAEYPGDLDEAVRTGELAHVEGIGKGTLQVARELASTGRSSFLDELREQVPTGLVEMLRVPGLGVSKVRRIHEALQIDSLPELEAAAADGRLAALPQFGAKTAEKIRRGIAALRRAEEFRLFHHARAEAETLKRALAGEPGVERVEIAGSLRRRCELIRDVDLVVQHAPGTAPDFGTAWVRATGSATHLRQLESLGFDPHHAFPDEASVYRAAGLPWITPELREGLGEIAAASEGRLPPLVEERDLKGFLHCHSNYSDGSTTIAQWSTAAREAGYEWIGITDHSGSAAYAGGLKAGDVPRQHEEIDAVNRRGDGCRVLKGVEADILADGSLDYGPDVLDRFDFVIGSIHTRFGMTADEMTERLLRAMEDPHLTILGHPTGRLLLARDPY